MVLELADTINPRYRALVLLAGFASLRTGESLELRWMDGTCCMPKSTCESRPTPPPR